MFNGNSSRYILNLTSSNSHQHYKSGNPYKQYNDATLSNPPHLKRTKHHSYTDVDKYKYNATDYQLQGRLQEFSKQGYFYPMTSNINQSVSLYQQLMANQNDRLSLGAAKILSGYNDDDVTATRNERTASNEMDVDEQRDGLLSKNKTRLDVSNYGFSACSSTDYRGNDKNRQRDSIQQNKEVIVTANQEQDTCSTAPIKKINECKKKQREECTASNEDSTLREDIEQIYMNRFQSTPKYTPITVDFDGIEVTITGFQLIYSNSEDFKNIICNYPQHVQGHLKEMRRKMKNRVSFKQVFSVVFYQSKMVKILYQNVFLSFRKNYNCPIENKANLLWNPAICCLLRLL